MKLFNFFFKGLRGRLTLTYTMVTVLALMALEVVLFFSFAAFTGMWGSDKDAYLSDVVSTLVPDARAYMQPELDLPGLQVWLDTVYRRGYASLEAQDIYDSPAAKIVKGSTMYILDPDGEVVVQTPPAATNEKYMPLSRQALNNALKGVSSVSAVSVVDTDGNYWIAVPIFQKNHDKPVLGALIVTVEPVPARELDQWLLLLFLLMLAGGVLLLALAPFGAIFGFFISSGLSKRLKGLSLAAEAWGKGNFNVMPPVDRTQDEISALSLQMRTMAEKIQTLMQDQQALAQMKERNRLAQELHDTVKQQNFATLMQIRAARNLIHTDPDGVKNSLLEAENLLKDSQQELGLLIGELRPPALEGKGLPEALRDYAETWSVHACIPVTCQIDKEMELPLDVERSLFRVAQEGLSNVARHSRASAVTVWLNRDKDWYRLEIQDNGIGFDPIANQDAGFGLISMRDRMYELNGKLEVYSGDESGTRLVALVPLAQMK